MSKNFEPTLDEPTELGNEVDKTFKKHIVSKGMNMNTLNNPVVEKKDDNISLKKKIWDLAKMEGLVFSDDNLKAIYNDMEKNASEKYGYHYNETIMNMIFNDYILNSPKYLAKYKGSVPVKKKRRGKEEIDRLQKDTEKPNEGIEEGVLGKSGDDSRYVEYVRDMPGEVDFQIGDEKFYYVIAKYPNGKNDIGIYAKGKDLVYGYEWFRDNYLKSTQRVSETTSAGGSAGSVGGDSRADGYQYVGPFSSVRPKILDRPVWRGGEVVEGVGLSENYLTESLTYKLIMESMDAIDKLDESFVEDDAEKAKSGILRLMQKDQTAAKDPAIKQTFAAFDALSKTGNYTEFNKIMRQNPTDYKNLDIMGMDTQKNTPNDPNASIPNEFSEGDMDEKAESKSQQRFMGMVHALQKGDMKKNDASPAVKKAAKSIDHDDAKKFASTSHSGLPNKVSENSEEMDQKYYGILKKYGVNSADELSKKQKIKFLASLEGASANESIIDQEGETMAMSADNPDSMKMKDTGSVTGPDITSPNMPMQFENDGVSEGVNDGVNEDGYCRSNEKPVPGKRAGEEGSCMRKDKEDTTKKKKSGIDHHIKSDDRKKNNRNVEQRIKREREQEKNREKLRTKLNPKVDTKKQKEMDKEKNKKDTISKPAKASVNEEKKPGALVDLDRLRVQNEKNFNKELKNNSSIEQMVNADIDPDFYINQDMEEVQKHKSLADIEKEILKRESNALENDGDSTREEGKIPKRNNTNPENKELDLNRGGGMEDLQYDNDPGEKFLERMKDDMGEEIYKKREEKLEYKDKAPMYNKDTAPVEDRDEKDNDVNLKRNKMYNESITGRYVDTMGNTRFTQFKFDKAVLTESANDEWIELELNGVGNLYTEDFKINESFQSLVNENKFYLGEDNVYRITSKKEVIKESEEKIETPPEKSNLNEGLEHLKHLIDYDPSKRI